MQISDEGVVVFNDGFFTSKGIGEFQPWTGVRLYNTSGGIPDASSTMPTQHYDVSNQIWGVWEGSYYNTWLEGPPDTAHNGYFSASTTDGSYYGAITFGGAGFSADWTDLSKPTFYFGPLVRSGGVWSISGAGCDTSRIDSVDPVNFQTIATSSLPYDFNVLGYISPGDYRDGARVMIKLDRNTDQQAVGSSLAFDSAFGNKNYFPVSLGNFSVGTSSDDLDLGARIGLYNAYYELQTPKFSLFGFSFFYETVVATSTRFTIGTTTALDNIQLAQEEYLQGLIDAEGGDPLAACHFSLFDSALDLTLGSSALNCLGGLLHWAFVLPPGVLTSTMTQLKDGFLTRAPWGYFTRVVGAISGTAETELPTVHADIPIPNDDGFISLDFDIDEIITDSAALQDTFETPDHKTAREILEPIIQLMVGLLVLMFLYNDIVSSIRRI